MASWQICVIWLVTKNLRSVSVVRLLSCLANRCGTRDTPRLSITSYRLLPQLRHLCNLEGTPHGYTGRDLVSIRPRLVSWKRNGVIDMAVMISCKILHENAEFNCFNGGRGGHNPPNSPSPSSLSRKPFLICLLIFPKSKVHDNVLGNVKPAYINFHSRPSISDPQRTTNGKIYIPLQDISSSSL